MIVLRSDEEISKIRQAGRIVANTLEEIRSYAKPGVRTDELDKIAEKTILEAKGYPAFKNYRGFPASVCVSPNEVVVHGIPSSRRLIEGDIVSIDVGVGFEGYYADAAVTFGIGKISKDAAALLKVTGEALLAGMDNARPGKRLSDISFSIQNVAESAGYNVVRAFVGHGIGTSIHEEPEVPNFGVPNTGVRLERGMVLAIEPMVNVGTFAVEVLEDGWTVVTKDRKLSAHFEHTLVVRDDGHEILTTA